MTSCCPHWNQPMTKATSSSNGTTRRVYVRRPAMLSDPTGSASREEAVVNRMVSALGVSHFSCRTHTCLK
jgi:hypothetical protein